MVSSISKQSEMFFLLLSFWLSFNYLSVTFTNKCSLLGRIHCYYTKASKYWQGTLYYSLLSAKIDVLVFDISIALHF